MNDAYFERFQALEREMKRGSQIFWDFDAAACECKPFRLIEPGGKSSWFCSLREMADMLIWEREEK